MNARRTSGVRPTSDTGRAAVLGTGGIGGLVAARTGALCVGTERSVAAIRARGLSLVQAGVTTVTRPEAVERLERPVALLVVAVKAYDLDEALDRLEPEALAGAVVLPLLNGLEHLERIRACSSLEQARPALVVVAGSIGAVEAFSPEPAIVVQRTPGARIVVASDELEPESLDRALAPLRVPGLEVVLGDGERAVLWEKAARLAVLAVAAVTAGRTVGELRDDGEWRERMRAALDESLAVASAEGVSLAASDQWAIIESLPFDLVPSGARDAAAGRPTELDAIAGSVIRAGARRGVPTPVLAELLAEAQRGVHA